MIIDAHETRSHPGLRCNGSSMMCCMCLCTATPSSLYSPEFGGTCGNRLWVSVTRAGIFSVGVHTRAPRASLLSQAIQRTLRPIVRGVAMRGVAEEAAAAMQVTENDLHHPSGHDTI